MEAVLKKAGLFVPLLIAAGYFLFLIATWNKFLAFQAGIKAKVDEYLDQLPKPGGAVSEPDVD